jgi:hypothetical protein
MTTSINRQLTLLVQGILGKHKVDSLQLEVDLVSSLQRMWTEGGRDPSKLTSIREDILKSMLAGGLKEHKMAEMEGRVRAALSINIDGRSRYEDMLKFILKKDEQGQTIEQYAKWIRENPYDAPKPFKIAEKPDMLMLTWDMAFAPQSVRKPAVNSGRRLERLNNE